MTQGAQKNFVVIGAGLAGSEAALRLARAGHKVILYEQKPKHFSPVHKLPGAAELVCSNSFKSTEVESAHGCLKQELRLLGSPLVELAYEARVPGGKSLSVDREKFSQAVTHAILSEKNIDFRCEQVSELPQNFPTLIATGPLTSQNLIEKILKECGDEGLYFYDATSPVVALDSLDLSKFFWASRNEDGNDYLNLPLNREQYENFRDQVLAAEKVESHGGEELKFFEGCLPIEVLAERGKDTLAFSCMKPVGFEAHLPKRAYAIIQFRREKAAGELLNMVGFQTRMKWPEQDRVFRTLPGMADAVFERFGAMHRNTFINAPLHLDARLSLKRRPQIFMAGQITGSEGYSEALATGHYAALQMMEVGQLPPTSAIQSLVRYLIESDPKYFQPMNFNFGLLPPVTLPKGKMKEGKRARNQVRSQRALEDLTRWINERLNSGLKIFPEPKCSNANSHLTPIEHAESISNVS
jgi:methylenetetrahydrofolate--tRNA-(uracil-5-)-methyltransferase